jgi:hypothetical protein
MLRPNETINKCRIDSMLAEITPSLRPRVL